MNSRRYNYLLTPSPEKYLFFSQSPGGLIRKFVRFTFCVARDVPYYHLSFGEWNESLQVIEDITHHSDAAKVLTTVAAITLHFTNNLPDAVIYMEPSVDWPFKDLKIFFDVYGLSANQRWEAFRPGRQYGGFLLKRKKRCLCGHCPDRSPTLKPPPSIFSP